MQAQPELSAKEEYPKDLQQVLKSPEIQGLAENIRKNIGLAIICGDQHTTQGFKTAGELKDAFAGRLTEFEEEAIRPQVEQLKQEHAGVMQEYGIVDQDLFDMLKKVWIYSRLTNPKIELLEESISTMESAEKTAVFASGLATIKAVMEQFLPPHNFKPGLIARGRRKIRDILPEKLQHLVPEATSEHGEYAKGGKVVVIGAIYGGTYTQVQKTCRVTGRQFEHLTISEFLKNGLPKDAKMVFFEGSNNPNLNASPIPQIVEEAKKIGAVTVCDNTFTPLATKPVESGVDLSIHSMTKYIGGESMELGGSVSGSAEKINQLTLDLHNGERMVNGASMSPSVAEKFLGNMQNLPDRLYFATQNARVLRDISEANGLKVKLTDSFNRYPGNRSENAHDSIVNGMINIDFGTIDAAEEFVNAMIKEGIGMGAVSLGAKMTYYSIPASTTHSEMPPEEQLRAGIRPGMVRISCGIESDLAKKFEKVVKRVLSGEKLHTPKFSEKGFQGSFFERSGQPQKKVA